MKVIFRFGLVCGLNGALACAVASLPLELYDIFFTLTHWPADGNLEWFLNGTLSLTIGLFLLGLYMGAAGGFICGIIGRALGGRMGWALGGIMGGMASCFWMGMTYLLLQGKEPVIGNNQRIAVAVITLLFGTFGIAFGNAIRRGKPKMLYLDKLMLR